MKPEIVAAADCTDYIQAELTDREELIDPIGTLRTVYPNILQILLSKNGEKTGGEYKAGQEERRKDIPELFREFYGLVRGEEPDGRRMELIREAAKEAEAEDHET